jgi:hypothetical protein
LLLLPCRRCQRNELFMSAVNDVLQKLLKLH